MEREMLKHLIFRNGGSNTKTFIQSNMTWALHSMCCNICYPLKLLFQTCSPFDVLTLR